jgi:hypothetical protein
MLNADGTNVRLTLGKFAKKGPLSLSVSGLVGGNGVPVPAFMTGL